MAKKNVIVRRKEPVYGGLIDKHYIFKLLLMVSAIIFILFLFVGDLSENCYYDNKKVLDMWIEDDSLKITFQDCSNCEHYGVCFDRTETWYFEEKELPTHFKIGDYVRMFKCEGENNWYSKSIEKNEKM